MLRHFGIKPILVFDGGPLPMKTDQEIKRARYWILSLNFLRWIDLIFSAAGNRVSEAPVSCHLILAIIRLRHLNFHSKFFCFHYSLIIFPFYTRSLGYLILVFIEGTSTYPNPVLLMVILCQIDGIPSQASFIYPLTST